MVALSVNCTLPCFRHRSTSGVIVASEHQHASWVASAYGDCTRICLSSLKKSRPNLAFQQRNVTCNSTDGDLLPAALCEQYAKPRRFRHQHLDDLSSRAEQTQETFDWRRCHCGVMGCSNQCEPIDDVEDELEGGRECTLCLVSPVASCCLAVMKSFVELLS